jgi:peptidoglycan/LPS O-acetylase OafA/YrhL
MKNAGVLLVDAMVNFFLGILLVVFPAEIFGFIGLPVADHAFYPTILGAVLIGIAVALIIEFNRKPESMAGLGLGGAIAINLCAAFVLCFWLLNGKLPASLSGRIILWILVILLVIISVFEILVFHKKKK